MGVCLRQGVRLDMSLWEQATIHCKDQAKWTQWLFFALMLILFSSERCFLHRQKVVRKLIQGQRWIWVFSSRAHGQLDGLNKWANCLIWESDPLFSTLSLASASFHPYLTQMLSEKENTIQWRKTTKLAATKYRNTIQSIRMLGPRARPFFPNTSCSGQTWPFIHTLNNVP